MRIGVAVDLAKIEAESAVVNLEDGAEFGAWLCPDDDFSHRGHGCAQYVLNDGSHRVGQGERETAVGTPENVELQAAAWPVR